MNLTKIKKLVYRVLIDGNEKICLGYDEYLKYKEKKDHYVGRTLEIIRLNWRYRILNKELDRGLDSLKMPESQATHILPPQELTDKLLKYDVVSFDIFDTLIFRAVCNPKDVFRLLESEWHIMGFAEKREKAEKLAREKNPEASLDDIYEILSKELAINKIQAIQKELDIEQNICFANPYMKQIFDQVNAKKETVLISDMYLSTEMLNDLLHSCGYYVDESQIYVSCEYGVGKSNGKLQKIVSKKYEPKTRFIHVGDNWSVDINGSKRIGWDTFYYPNVNREGIPYRPTEMLSVASAFYKGLVNAKLHNGIFNKNEFYEYGYCYGGLMAIGYCQYLNRLAKNESIDQFLFLARDGFIVKEIYDHFIGDTDSEYIPFSRFASYQLTIDRCWPEMLHHVVGSRINAKSLETVEEVLELSDLTFLKKYLKIYGISLNQRFDLSVYNKINQIFQENISEIKLYFQETVDAAKKYFSEKVRNSGKVCVVDVGWQGTGAICLKYFLEEVCGFQVEVCGALLGMVKNDTAEINIANRSLFSYMFSPHHNQRTYLCHAGKRRDIPYRDMLVEIFFTENHPSFLKFRLNEKGDVVLDYGRKDNNQEIIENLQCGIMDFVRDYAKYWKCFGAVLEICGQEAYIPIDSLAKAKKICMKLFGNYEVNENPGIFEEKMKRTYKEAVKQ